MTMPHGVSKEQYPEKAVGRPRLQYFYIFYKIL